MKIVERLQVTCDDQEEYIPCVEEIDQLAEVEEIQRTCKHINFTDEDGCLDCGYYSK